MHVDADVKPVTGPADVRQSRQKEGNRSHAQESLQ
jgi:hypothetical protein